MKFVEIWDVYSYAGKKNKGVKGVPTLGWCARYKVAMGIAEAIEYLHNGTERCVVHRDIKPSNILLSSKKIPKVRMVNFVFMCCLVSSLRLIS